MVFNELQELNKDKTQFNNTVKQTNSEFENQNKILESFKKPQQPKQPEQPKQLEKKESIVRENP